MNVDQKLKEIDKEAEYKKFEYLFSIFKTGTIVGDCATNGAIFKGMVQGITEKRNIVISLINNLGEPCFPYLREVNYNDITVIGDLSKKEYSYLEAIGEDVRTKFEVHYANKVDPVKAIVLKDLKDKKLYWEGPIGKTLPEREIPYDIDAVFIKIK